MNQQLDFIFGRRSIRVYKPGPVSDETSRQILEAAMAAPSAVAKDPWRFVVVRNPQTLIDLNDRRPIEEIHQQDQRLRLLSAR